MLKASKFLCDVQGTCRCFAFLLVNYTHIDTSVIIPSFLLKLNQNGEIINTCKFKLYSYINKRFKVAAQESTRQEILEEIYKL